MSRPQLWHGEGREWIPHSTSRCPVSGEVIVKLQFANGHISKETEACRFIWAKRGWAHDVVAYQIVGAANG